MQNISPPKTSPSCIIRFRRMFLNLIIHSWSFFKQYMKEKKQKTKTTHKKNIIKAHFQRRTSHVQKIYCSRSCALDSHMYSSTSETGLIVANAAVEYQPFNNGWVFDSTRRSRLLPRNAFPWGLKDQDINIIISDEIGRSLLSCGYYLGLVLPQASVSKWG